MCPRSSDSMSCHVLLSVGNDLSDQSQRQRELDVDDATLTADEHTTESQDSIAVREDFLLRTPAEAALKLTIQNRAAAFVLLVGTITCFLFILRVSPHHYARRDIIQEDTVSIRELLYPATEDHVHDVHHNTSLSVYVPGAGFSGFFYVLGHLRSLSNLDETQFYCFSAGCLGVVATLRNITVDEITDMAFDIQNQWWLGNISRYDIPRMFVDRLLPHPMELDDHTLSQLNVITTGRPRSFSWSPFPSHVVRQPASTAELRAMLVQTTHIPFATGWGLWNNNHSDGGFSLLSHPPCDYSIRLPLRWDIFANVVNPSLNRDQVHKFYNMGTEANIPSVA